MRRNSAWRKNNLREIKHTVERYLAIMVIIVLGVGFFAGLKITQSAMINNLDNYAKEQKMYDFKLLSSLGLTKEDVQHFQMLDGITAEGIVSTEFIADFGMDNDVVLKAHSISSEINLLSIQSGRMPQADNEIVVDGRCFSEDIIGAKINIAKSNDQDTKDRFTYEKYVVVGIVNSVNYINYDRGTTNLAGGMVYGYIYMPKGGFATDYYTEILIALDGDYKVYSDEYESVILEKEECMEETLETRANLRYQEIVKEAREKVLDAEKEYNEGYEEYLIEKTDAEKELKDAWLKLDEAQEEILEGEEELRKAEKDLSQGEDEYIKGIQDYEEALRKYEAEKVYTLSKLEENQIELNDNRTMIVAAMNQIEETGILDQYIELNKTIESLEEVLAEIEDLSSEEYIYTNGLLEETKEAVSQIDESGVIEKYKELENNFLEIEEGQNELKLARDDANRQLASAKSQLDNAKLQLDNAKEEIESGKKEIIEGWRALEDAKIQYEDGLKEYEEGKKEAEESFAEAEEELADAREEIDKAWQEVYDIPEAKTFVLNRQHNIGYASFENDSAIVDGIAKVLPIFFFLVAALVCTTTMTRMVNEQRTQIGTLKALGYSDGSITRKYIFYSGSSAFIGFIIGYFIGTKFFPMAIMEAYGMIYDMPPIEFVFDIELAIICLVISIFCSVGVTYISCKNELRQMPAQLIRPKAPKPGKRVLLERVGFIWKRIDFLYKVTIRNLFRYKKRFFMTVLGIAGCTALTVAALGISDSVRNIANDQFDEIMTYDYRISFDEEQSQEERKRFSKEFSDVLSESVFIASDEVEIMQSKLIKKASVIATDDLDIINMVGLYSEGEVIAYPPHGQVVVSDGLAHSLGLGQGDSIVIKINEIETIDVEISGVFDNYVGNYILMTGVTYEEVFKEEPLYNNAFAKANDNDIYSVSAKISDYESVTTVLLTKDTRIMVDNMMKSLDNIILLVIAAAVALGLVVIYNLNNINIRERSREIATIKVLGFYDNESRAYIFRETLVLTIISIIFGLLLGKLLHSFIMSQINVDAVSFKVEVFWSSYLIAALITIVLSLIVNLMFKRKIEDVNMTESLKSVE